MKSDFQKFKKECEYWIDAFGLSDWMIEIIHQDLPAVDSQCKARCSLNLQQRAARITLNKAWINDPVNSVAGHSIDGTALHEVLHIVFAAYGEACALLQSADHNLAQAEEHGMMRRIMRALSISAKR